LGAVETNRIIIFDTTLRDGGLGLVESLSLAEKLEIAKQLADSGVDVLEVGYPANSQADFALLQTVAQEVKDVTVAGLARANLSEIDYCWQALKEAQKPRLHVYLSVSDLFLKQLFKIDRAKGLELAEKAVAHAKTYCADVEFSAHDATRADPEYLGQIIETAIRAGATTVSIPDTNGFATAEEFAKLITTVRENVPNIEQATIAVHCHNVQGLAVANSLAALQAGARQIECSVNGIGAQAGNTNLQEVVVALPDIGFSSDINLENINLISLLVDKHIWKDED
jgi:2-isopropylmalate synthase